MKTNKFLCALLTLAILIGIFTIPVMANDDIKVLLNGTELTFDVPPQLIEGRTMVPMRKIFEAMGATVDWNDSTQTVTAKKGYIVIIMQIDNVVISVSSKEITLDVPPQLVDSRTLVPVRAVAEGLDADVKWIDETRTVVITKAEEPVATPTPTPTPTATPAPIEVVYYNDIPWAPDFGLFAGLTSFEKISAPLNDDAIRGSIYRYSLKDIKEKEIIDQYINMIADELGFNIFQDAETEILRTVGFAKESLRIAVVVYKSNATIDIMGSEVKYDMVYYDDIPWVPDFGFFAGLSRFENVPISSQNNGTTGSMYRYSLGDLKNTKIVDDYINIVIEKLGFSKTQDSTVGEQRVVSLEKGNKRIGVFVVPSSVSINIIGTEVAE